MMPGSSSDGAAPPPGGLSRPDMNDDAMDESFDVDEGGMEVEHVAHEVEQNFIGNVDHSKEGLGSLEPDIDDGCPQGRWQCALDNGCRT